MLYIAQVHVKLKIYIRSFGNDAKTDILDAKALASYGAERKDKLQLFVPKSNSDIELYQLAMRKQDLTKMLIAEKTRLQGPNIRFTRESCQYMIDTISEQIKLTNNQISSLIDFE